MCYCLYICVFFIHQPYPPCITTHTHHASLASRFLVAPKLHTHTNTYMHIHIYTHIFSRLRHNYLFNTVHITSHQEPTFSATISSLLKHCAVFTLKPSPMTFPHPKHPDISHLSWKMLTFLLINAANTIGHNSLYHSCNIYPSLLYIEACV